MVDFSTVETVWLDWSSIYSFRYSSALLLLSSVMTF